MSKDQYCDLKRASSYWQLEQHVQECIYNDLSMLQLLFYNLNCWMRLISRLLVAAFFLQYYLTLFCTVLLKLARRVIGFGASKPGEKIHPYHNTHEAVFSWMDQFIRLDGYSLEDHRFATEDGAEVHLWRIRRQNPPPDKPFPVVIMHGLLESASTWFLAAEKANSLPYLLAAQGYEVWVGNNRGNRISQSSPNYHNYNIDHLVTYDQPTIIKGVLEISNKQKLIYIGHSQGSTQFLLALGQHKELKDKIAGFVGMGTIVSLASVKENGVLNLCSRIYLFQILSLLGFSQLLLISKWMSQAIGVMLSNSRLHLKVILKGIKHLVGRNGHSIPPHMVAVIFTHEPGGGSVNNVLHWIQCFRSRQTFRKFCYGPRKNKQLYGTEQAPEYCLKHLKELPFSSFLFRGGHDGLASKEDFQELIGYFSEERVRSVQLKEYNHLDYLWGHRAHLDIYHPVLSFVNSCS